MGFQLVEKLSITHLKDFMGPTMEKTNYYLTYLYPILERANPTLYDCLVKYVVRGASETVVWQSLRSMDGVKRGMRE